jgi:hypothetical protein
VLRIQRTQDIGARHFGRLGRFLQPDHVDELSQNVLYWNAFIKRGIDESPNEDRIFKIICESLVSVLSPSRHVQRSSLSPFRAAIVRSAPLRDRERR